MAQATLSTTERAGVPAIRQTRLFINNEWGKPFDGTFFDTYEIAGGLRRHCGKRPLCYKAYPYRIAA